MKLITSVCVLFVISISLISCYVIYNQYSENERLLLCGGMTMMEVLEEQHYSPKTAKEIKSILQENCL